MRQGWIYEVIASTSGEKGPHAAPIGILTPDGLTLKAELYKGSTTLDNILRTTILGLNLIHDAAILHKALYRREELTFAPLTQDSATPFVLGADAWLDLKITRTTETRDKYVIEAEPAACHVQAPVSPLNRAHGLLLESLVLSTRRYVLPRDIVREQLLENARVIAKVAPDSPYQDTIQDLLRSIGIEE